MANQQHQQHYYDNAPNNSADEVDALLNSLVGAQPHPSAYNSYDYNSQHQNSNNYFNYYPNNSNGPPPQLPPRTEHSGYINNGDTMEDSNKYYYSNENNGGYPPSNNHYDGYPPMGNHYDGYPPQQSTPLPQRVASTANDYGSMIDSSTPPAGNNMYSMPTPQYQSQYSQENVYPPPQYHHQRNLSGVTTSPPGSPPRYPQTQTQAYQNISGYPDSTQEMITSSFRPAFAQNVSDSSTNVSTHSSLSTPPLPPYNNNNGYRVPPAAQSAYNQSTRRNPSSLRSNVIMTIERPRYDYLPENENPDDGEVPFIPVSPDTSDDDEYFSTTVVQKGPPAYHANEYSREDHPPPVVAPIVENRGGETSSGMTYNDPTQFYMYPPATQDPVQVPKMTENDHYYPQEEYPREKEPMRDQYSSQYEQYSTQQEPVREQYHMQQEPIQLNPSQQQQEKDIRQVESAVVVQEAPPRITGPNYGLFSVLSTAFIRHVKGLENVRELWCASEYNESFTGSEAVTIIKGLLNEQVPEEYCVIVANALMRCKPALFLPTQYSQRSIISNTMYNSDDTYYLEEDVSDDTVPIGVLPSLTPCYSYTCRPGQGGCYSERCPNNGKDFVSDNKVEVTISRNNSFKSTSSPAGGWMMPHEAWAASVDRELLKTLDSKEIGRQEVLNETMYSEEKYLSDLTILHEVVVQGLEKSGAIANERLAHFCQTVFNNYQELLQISEALFKDLLARFRENIGKCVPTIGDILIQHMQFFEKPYVTYSPQAQMAKYLAELEIKNNPEFEKFTKEITKHERTDRLPIWHYLLCPVTRMQRYPLLIEGLLKKTPKDHPDHVFLTRSYEIIRSVASKADNQALHVKDRLAILHIRDRILFKQGEVHDLALDNPNRRLYYSGVLKRRSGTLDVADKNDIFAFVFDHMVIMTKMRNTSTDKEYRISKKPIPLQMLVVQTNTANVRYQLTGTNTPYNTPASGQVGSGVALTLHHLGSRGGAVYPFYCQNMEEKLLWTKAIDDAKASMKKRHGDSDIFELRPLDDVNFRNVGTNQPGGISSRINCSVPFLSCKDEKKIAIGTDSGVFFKTEGQDSVRRIIQCESVTQMAVIEKYHILIVLTEKALRAYPIDVLDSKSNTKAIDRVQAEIATNVNFFQIGFCNGRDMLVFKKKKNTSSVFVSLEPFCDLRDPKNEKLLTYRPSLFGKPDYLRWFKKYKDFYIGADASNIHFLKAKINVVCERGFEVIDPENLHASRDIPDTEDPEFYFVTRHAEPLKPLAMYRVNDKFLLCYDKFAFYVNNRNGSLVPRPDKRKPATICEWEGTPTHILYDHPYIIAIDPYFIEIRHESGELVQIISGENIRLAYYNGGGEKSVIHVCMTHSQKPDTQALFQLVLSSHRNSAGYPRRN